MKLTKKSNHDNVILLILVWWCIMINLVLVFENSSLFRVIGVIATLITIFTVAWFKFILMDEFVHSFWLKERMKRGFKCVYGYGIDEYFVLSRFQLLTGILTLTFIVLNSVDVISGVFSSWSLIIEGFISFVFVCSYCIQLSKYKSAFGFNEVIVPLVSSCIGLLVTAMITPVKVLSFGLFLFFAFSYIVCANEIMSAAKNLAWGNRAVVRVEDEILDSEEHQFYLIFYSENNIEIVIKEDGKFKHGKINKIECVEQLPRLFDRLKVLEDSVPLWVRIIERFMGLSIFNQRH